VPCEVVENGLQAAPQLIGSQRFACVHAGKDECAEIVPIVACDHGVLDVRRAGGIDPRTQRPDTHPSAGCQLEILRHAPVELESLLRVGVIEKAQRVPRAVVAFLIERRRGQLGRSPVARRDARAAKACFELVGHWHELHLHTVHRQPDRARAQGTAVREHRGRRGNQ